MRQELLKVVFKKNTAEVCECVAYMKYHIGEQTSQQTQKHLCKNALLPPFDLSVLLSRVSQIPRGSIC